MPIPVFKVRRIPQHAGPDRDGDLFSVMAVGHSELVRTRESPSHAYLNGNSSREECQRLCDALTATWDSFWNGTAESKGGAA